MRLSAYLSIFDDWDILPDALAAVAPYVDEIVVVDGAYRWMAPMLRSSGRDPSRSLPEVYAALRPYADKVRVIDGLWDEELQKRAAGYAACKGRYILRFDADEIMCVTSGLIEAAIARDYPVASVEMPTYGLPGWLIAIPRADGSLGDIERQCVFFDSFRISAQEHLSYLWLVLGKTEQALLGQADPQKVDPAPLAFNAHLTCWRTPATARHRARFYVMNWMRDAGTIPWLGGITAQASDGFDAFFATMPPRDFEAFLLGHEITSGQPGFGRWTTRPSPPQAPALERRLGALFSGFVGSLALLNEELALRGRLLLARNPCCIDVSTTAAVAALGAVGDRLGFSFDQPLKDVVVDLLELDPVRGVVIRSRLAATIEGHCAWLTLPALPADIASHPIRRTLELVADVPSGDRVLHMAPARPGLLPGTVSVASAPKARELSAAQNWPAAARAWQQIEHDEGLAEEALVCLGEALRELKDFAAAEALCDRAWRRFPGNMWIGRNWALLPMWQHDWSEAVRRFREVCATHDHDALDADLARCLMAAGCRDEAWSVLDGAGHRFPHSQWLASVRLELTADRQGQPA